MIGRPPKEGPAAESQDIRHFWIALGRLQDHERSAETRRAAEDKYRWLIALYSREASARGVLSSEHTHGLDIGRKPKKGAEAQDLRRCEIALWRAKKNETRSREERRAVVEKLTWLIEMYRQEQSAPAETG